MVNQILKDFKNGLITIEEAEEKLSLKISIKEGDTITDGVFKAYVDSSPLIKADIIWQHNEIYDRDVNISRFKKIEI